MSQKVGGIMKNKVLAKKLEKETLRDYLWNLLNSTETMLNDKVEGLLIVFSTEDRTIGTLSSGKDIEVKNLLVNLKLELAENMLKKMGVDTKKLFEKIELSKTDTEILS